MAQGKKMNDVLRKQKEIRGVSHCIALRNLGNSQFLALEC